MISAKYGDGIYGLTISHNFFEVAGTSDAFTQGSPESSQGNLGLWGATSLRWNNPCFYGLRR